MMSKRSRRLWCGQAENVHVRRIADAQAHLPVAPVLQIGLGIAQADGGSRFDLSGAYGLRAAWCEGAVGARRGRNADCAANRGPERGLQRATALARLDEIGGDHRAARPDEVGAAQRLAIADEDLDDID